MMTCAPCCGWRQPRPKRWSWWTIFSGFCLPCRKDVDSLPLWLFSPDLNGNTLRVGPAGKPLCLHWPRWSIEPLGAGLPIALLPELETVLGLDCTRRPELQGADPVHIRQAAYLFRLDRLCGRNRYRDGLKLLPFITSPEYAASAVPPSVMTSDY